MFGQVTDYQGNPVFMVKVGVYHDGVLIKKEYTGEDGRYTLDFSSDAPVTILFDMHTTLNTSDKWHPSILSNMIVGADRQVDRILSSTEAQPDDQSAIDALGAYLFATAYLNQAADNYAGVSARRLGTIKFADPALHEVQQKLIQHLAGQ
jgi:hypothetical protein